MEDDYEQIGATCPKCNHSPLHRRDCDNFSCEDGYYDESDDDPINFMPGETFSKCQECKGTGSFIWCPECGEDLTGKKIEWEEDCFD